MKPKTIRWNADIDWLINYAPAELGERGSAPSAVTVHIDATEKASMMHDQAGAAMPAVQRERHLRAIACMLQPGEYALLCEYYRRRTVCHVTGAVAAFSEGPIEQRTHAGGAFVALLLARQEGREAELHEALASQSKSRSIPVISHYRRRVADEMSRVHALWDWALSVLQGAA